MSHAVQPLEVFPPPSDFPNLVTSVRREASYHFYGALSTSNLANSASNFILTHCTGDRAGLTQALSSFLDDAAANARQHSSLPDRERSIHSAWLCIRITLPTTAWVIPRWHRDGRMFDCSCAAPQPHAKYAVTLLGPPTRMLPQSVEVDDLIRGVLEARTGWYEKNREELAAALKGVPPIELRKGQVVRFTWGQEDAPVHSEPDSSADERVFVSVLFGCEEELRNMCHFRGETYGDERIRKYEL